MDASLVTRRSNDDFWRPVNASLPRARPQSGARAGRHAAYFALWQQRQARGRAQSSRPLGTPRSFVAPQRPPSGLQPRPPSAALVPHPPNAPPDHASSPPRTTTVLVAQPPSGPPPRPDARNPILFRGRLPRRVLSSHFGGPQTKDIVVDPDKRVQLVSPPDFSAQDIVVAPPVPWKRLRGPDAPGMMEVKEEEEEEEEAREDDSKSDDELIFSQWERDDAGSSSVTATPPPLSPKFVPRPPAEPPDGITNIRSILKRARMREARLAPASAYLPSPMHGPVPQETELTEILTIRPKPVMHHTQREPSGRHFPVKQSDRGVRFDMASTEVFEIARRRPQRPSIYPDSFSLL